MTRSSHVLIGISIVLGISFSLPLKAQKSFIAALEWEARTYTPAEYRGKALPVPGATVRVALITPAAVAPADLAIEWQLDGNRIAGSDPTAIEFIATREPGLSHTVVLRLRHKKNGLEQDAALLVPVARPEAAIYPLRDRFASPYRATQSLALDAGKSVSVSARAFFFPGGAPLFYWTVNDEKIPGSPRLPYQLTITAPVDAPAPASKRIQIIAQHPRFAQMKAAAEITVEIR